MDSVYFLRVLQGELRQGELADDNQAIEQAQFQRHLDDQSSAVDRRRSQLGQSWPTRLHDRLRRYVLSGSRDRIPAVESGLQCHKLSQRYADQNSGLRQVQSERSPEKRISVHLASLEINCR